MKKSIFLFLSIAFVLSSFNSQNQQSTPYQVETATSVVYWKGYKPGGSQKGMLHLQSGTIDVTESGIVSGYFVADMHTIKAASGSEKLTAHLKSEDFFEVNQFPTASFKIVKIVKNNDQSTVIGDFTIKGITKRVSFPAKITIAPHTLKIESETFHINRADFNVKYKSKTFFNNLKEKFINNKFDLKVAIIATR